LRAPAFLQGPAEEAAPRLLGWRLLSTIDGEKTEVELTEVEAYTESDPASHSFRGLRPGNAVMFGPPGYLYVYRSYGVHWCANVVCGAAGLGAAILLRGGRPSGGIEVMTRRRGRSDRLASGPGNLTRALGITGEHKGVSLFDPRSPLRLLEGPAPERYLATGRIGITRAVDKPWRFVSL
jgi:DNA-3-methyladenine glycosylase